MRDFIELSKDIWDFLKLRKKYWLAPLIITILLLGALIIFTQGSVFAPLIYTVFNRELGMKMRNLNFNKVIFINILIFAFF